ncbi:MAG: type II toxin-antitoxin system HicA family toxin [Candidatus Daviesbacteria bacterium]|nr:type II toxin-antitoxin system HicA family toxin [Candidatus Daviesbacteria bacterium]
MSKLPQVKARDLVKIITRLGFRFRDQSGSHAVYTHSDGRRTTIPIHPPDTIGIGLLTKIIKKDLEITKDKFIKLLK